MRVLDLFSGIGGFSLGLDRAGMTTVAFCEIDPYCRRVLAKHWPEVPCYDDITTAEFTEGQADVVCGGFPCQDISFAGRGAGIAGERSGLFRHLVRAICMVRPRFAVLENVAALLCRGLGEVLGDLAESGHDAEWDCVPAGHVGAPHIRDRIWIVAYPAREPMGRAGQPRETLSADADDIDGRGRAGRQDRAQAGHGFEAGDAAYPPILQWPTFFGRRSVGSVRGYWREDWRQALGRLRGMADGVSSPVDRLRGLGNAVVPQIPELIGRAIMEQSA